MERSEFVATILDAYEAGELILICAWCGQVQIDREWVVPPPRTLSTVDEPMTFSHSICPTCAATQRTPDDLGVV